MKSRVLFRAVSDEKVAAIAARILSRPTAPFHEDAVIREAESFAAERPWLLSRRDRHGNLHLSRRGVRSARPIILSAHMDHPGFTARASRPAGKTFRVEADFLGGVEDRYFRGSPARFFTADGEVRARVLSMKKDPKTGERKTVLSARRTVPSGSFGMWDLPAFRREKDMLWSRAVDDLAGAAAALALLDVLPAVDPKGKRDVRAVLTRGEEVGFWGAIAAARSREFPPGAVLISLEASKALPQAPLGAGPVLRVGDRASVFDDGVTRALAAAARRLAESFPKNFRWQRKLMDGGTCEGTAYQALGLRAGALCVPLLNYHNMGERGRVAPEAARLSDLSNLVRWLAFWVVEGEPSSSLGDRMKKLQAAWRPRRLS